jgi:hypothetical protein
MTSFFFNVPSAIRLSMLSGPLFSAAAAAQAANTGTANTAVHLSPISILLFKLLGNEPALVLHPAAEMFGHGGKARKIKATS